MLRFYPRACYGGKNTNHNDNKNHKHNFKREKYNLNAISHDSAIALIRKVAQQVDVKEIYVDTVGIPEHYQARLETLFPDAKCTVAKKADSLFPIVSAASIVAKVTRDRVLEEWHHEHAQLDRRLGRDFGSGYPADPRTKQWLGDKDNNSYNSLITEQPN
jgi:ribonuclease H2 subunit A